jgi:gamma-glutamyl-gamma-aminobutyrate hydrolase PuuD
MSIDSFLDLYSTSASPSTFDSSGSDAESSINLSPLPSAIRIIESSPSSSLSPSSKSLEERLADWCAEKSGTPEHNKRVSATKKILDAAQSKATHLNLSGLQLTSLPEDLALLTHLEVLHLNGNRLTEVSVLGSMTNLQMLGLHMNQISDITPLRNLKKLRSLVLMSNRLISDIRPLAELPELRKLFISGTNVSDLRPLAKLRELRELNISGTRVQDVSHLAELYQLEALDLSNNLIDNIGALNKLMQLESLNVSNTRIEAIPLSFAILKRQSTVNATGAPLSFEAIRAFQQTIKQVRLDSAELGPEFILPYTTDFEAYDMVADLGFPHDGRPKIIRPVHVSAPTMGPKLTTLLEKLGAQPVEVDINFNDAEINPHTLVSEVHAGIERLRKAQPMLGFIMPATLMKLAKDDPETYPTIRKIQLVADQVVSGCDGLTLPGGPDVEREFYDPQAPLVVSDYRRSIAEMSLLEAAKEADMPVMGTCRGVQLINVYYGGTLRIAGNTGWETIELTDSSKRAQLEALCSDEPLNVYSQHFQSCAKIAPGFEVAMAHNDIPKLIMRNDSRIIGIQSHPECDEDGKYSKAIQIYRIFFKQIKDQPKG